MQKTLVSWNVNGIRACEKKGFLDWLHGNQFDIVGIQETKVSDISVLKDALKQPNGYHAYWNCSVEKKGYSGVAIYSKEKPKNIITYFGDNLLSKEGRMIQADYDTFTLLNIYFPNGGSGEERLQYKLTFYQQFLDYIDTLKKQEKKIIFCGDVNTAHTEIDLSRPKENMNTSGFMPIEREWINRFIEHEYIDTFREFHKEANQYTWWDQKTRARERNIGWRIDYFFITPNLRSHLTDAFIHQQTLGSDHCPLGIALKI